MAALIIEVHQRYLDKIIPKSDLWAFIALCTQRYPLGVTNKDMEANMHIHLPAGRQVRFVVGNPQIPYAMKVKTSLGIGAYVSRDGFPHQYKLTFDGLCLASALFVDLYPIMDIRPSCGTTLEEFIDCHSDNVLNTIDLTADVILDLTGDSDDGL